MLGCGTETGRGVPESKLRMCFKGSQEPSKPQSKRPAGCGEGRPSFKESHSAEGGGGGRKGTRKSRQDGAGCALAM